MFTVKFNFERDFCLHLLFVEIDERVNKRSRCIHGSSFKCNLLVNLKLTESEKSHHMPKAIFHSDFPKESGKRSKDEVTSIKVNLDSGGI